MTRGRPYLIIATVLGLAVLARLARGQLTGVPNPVMAPWSGQVIFGFYFAILAMGIQTLQGNFKSAADTPLPNLLLLALVSLCADLVLVNIQEVIAAPDASYGLVVIWDVMTFFVWFRVLDLCRPNESSAFRMSALVAAAPLFKLGREILFLPYSPPSVRAYLDLAFGDFMVCLWVFLHFRSSRPQQGSPRVLRFLVFSGCVYWMLNALENLLELGWSPISGSLSAFFARTGVPEYSLSIAYFVIAISTAAILASGSAAKLTQRFGVGRNRSM
jgi:hypothetical protein